MMLGCSRPATTCSLFGVPTICSATHSSGHIDKHGTRLLNGVETLSVVSTVILSASSVVCRSPGVIHKLRQVQEKEQTPVHGAKANLVTMGSQDLSLGDRLAIWTVLPLAILAVCSTVWRRQQQELADRNDIGPALSNAGIALDPQFVSMRQDLEKLEEQLARTRVKLKVIRMDLGKSIEELAGGQSNQSESYVQMAEHMRDTERRLAGCEEVLIKMQESSLRQFNALVTAMNQLRDAAEESK